VVNRWMSLAEGPWAWSAVLRYVEMALLLATWIALRRAAGKAFSAKLISSRTSCFGVSDKLTRE
jgi:hypothetical protein